MAGAKMEGNCYICGKTLGKTAMKNHIMKEHLAKGDEECMLLKIEGAHAKGYWLFVDIAKDKSLGDLDAFLREIWLECCGHLSRFSVGGYYGEISKKEKLGNIGVGVKILHEYDFGTTTECLITFIGETLRPRQKKAVRVLGRNAPPQDTCASCGKPAEYLCLECLYDDTEPCYCEECAEEHEHEDLLTLTNSPRCGCCGYEGELDGYTFNPAKFK